MEAHKVISQCEAVSVRLHVDPRNCSTDFDEIQHCASTLKLKFLLHTGFLLVLLLHPEDGDYTILGNVDLLHQTHGLISQKINPS
jgi:hypothetical protein